jgi:hypothetical protein
LGRATVESTTTFSASAPLSVEGQPDELEAVMRLAIVCAAQASTLLDYAVTHVIGKLPTSDRTEACERYLAMAEHVKIQTKEVK